VCEDENSNSASCAHSLDTSNGSIFNQLHIDTTGNVGIGINPITGTAPLELVHLDQTGANADVRVQFSNASSGATAADGSYIGIDDSDFGGVFLSSLSIWNRESSRIVFGTSDTQRMVINQLGRVGIGENLPGAMLTVKGGAGTLFLNPDFNGGTLTAFQTLATDLILATGNIERIRILVANGNVGVNTAIPLAKFHVATGNMLTTDADIEARRGNFITITNTTTGVGGRVGIGFSATAPTSAFHMATGAGQMRVEDYGGSGNRYVCVDTNGFITASSVVCTSSIRTVKRDITNLGLGLDAVMSLRPVEFNWQFSSLPRRQVGFIAEEVQAVSPLLAAYDDATGELRGVQYAQMSALLTRGLQELAAKVSRIEETAAGVAPASAAGDGLSELERQLKAQQRQIDELKALVNKLLGR